MPFAIGTFIVPLIVNAVLAGASIAVCGFFFPGMPHWLIWLIVLQISQKLQGHPTIVWADFWHALLVMGLFSVASIPVTMRMPANAGDEIVREWRGEA